MRNAEEFDEFYVSSRRRLLLQTFALTGDLSAATCAVREAYVAARHHWAKVGRLPDPEDYVRPRAWAAAQRRASTHLWHKEKDLSAEQAAVLEALHRLPDIERKTLLLTHLAALSMPDIGREIGETQERAERHLQAATSSTAIALDIASSSIRSRLDSLEPIVARVKLPRAPIIRRGGRNRRRTHAFAGALVLALVTVGAGAFVATGKPKAPPPTVVQHPVTRAMLLPLAQARALGPKQRWQLQATDDNTRGSGLNSLCQGSRFADERGLGTLVRHFASSGRPQHRLVETVDISASPGAAGSAYRTTVGWFAGCADARLQLLSAYRVRGIGNEGQMLRLRIPDRQEHSYLVAIARTGSLTVTTLLETRGGRSPDVRRLVSTLAASVRPLCASDEADLCVTNPSAAPVLPPPSGEGRGMLAVADLPPVGKIRKPWVGTRPKLGGSTLAATTCDRSDFVRSGARRPMTRSFLIPRAGLGPRFGLTETVGRFHSTKQARAFVALIKKRMRACPGDKLGSKIVDSDVAPRSYAGSEYALWRLENQVNRDEDLLSYWMGVARVGATVSQVSFTPVHGNDLDGQTFQSVITRARDRLFELGGRTP